MTSAAAHFRRLSLKELALRLVAALLGTFLLFLLGLPLLSLLVRVPIGELLDRLRDPIVVEALRLSLLTSAASTFAIMLLGLPVAYLLATAEFRGKRLLEVLVALPMVLPPTVAGVALLTAFGRTGLAGGVLAGLGVELPFSTLGVVVAQMFVAAPFFIGATRAGLAEVDRRYL
ncbi:MAG: molybdate ABC transporter permease subunit, partial [Gemmatimonadales bacterium]|nr:molybdate ABC transporter permease subunit [Gemmatimonadales bacterium]